jgi:hypothetical protein
MGAQAGRQGRLGDHGARPGEIESVPDGPRQHGGFYDFGKLDTSDNRPVLVDVGGGGGQSIMAIMAAHPNLASKPEKFILQDLPDPIAVARTAGRLPEGVVKMVHDFFTEQPVKGK